MTPARGRCLVRRVETAESYAGGKIVLPAVVRDKIAAQQVEVVDVGVWGRCDDLDCERPHANFGAPRREDRYHPFLVQPGAWVLIAHRSLVECGEPDAYLVNQDDIIAVLHAT